MAITGISDATTTWGYALVRRDPIDTDWTFIDWISVPVDFVVDTPPAAQTWVYGVAQIVGASAAGTPYGDIDTLEYAGGYRMVAIDLKR